MCVMARPIQIILMRFTTNEFFRKRRLNVYTDEGHFL
jgi:hypothetical protein